MTKYRIRFLIWILAGLGYGILAVWKHAPFWTLNTLTAAIGWALIGVTGSKWYANRVARNSQGPTTLFPKQPH
jgi:hypothetical protein